MKASVAVALIVGGVILIGLPPVADFLWQSSVARLSEAHIGAIASVGRPDATYRMI